MQSRIWGTIGALGLIYSNWYGYELQNVGGYKVFGSVAIPASCRPGGPLKLKMFVRDITTAGTDSGATNAGAPVLSFTTAAVPEASTMLLMAAGSLMLLRRGRAKA